MKHEASIIIADLRRQSSVITKMADDLEQLYASDLKQALPVKQIVPQNSAATKDEIIADMEDLAARLRMKWDPLPDSVIIKKKNAAPVESDLIMALLPTSPERNAIVGLNGDKHEPMTFVGCKPQAAAVERNKLAKEFILALPKGSYKGPALIGLLESAGMTGFDGNTRLNHLLDKMVKAKEIAKDGRKYLIGTKGQGLTLTDKAQVKEVKLVESDGADYVVPIVPAIARQEQSAKPVAIDTKTAKAPFDPFSDRVVGLMKMLPDTFSSMEIGERIGTQYAPVIITAWTQRHWMKQTKANSGRFERAEHCPK